MNRKIVDKKMFVTSLLKLVDKKHILLIPTLFSLEPTYLHISGTQSVCLTYSVADNTKLKLHPVLLIEAS